MTTQPPRRRRSMPPADESRVITPKRRQAKAAAARVEKGRPVGNDELDEAILRTLRSYPNRNVTLASLAAELGVDPMTVQLQVERLGRRRFVVVPFIEPDAAGGAELTEAGLRWLISREGGSPRDVPAALQPAREQVRPDAEAARLPRAQVYRRA